MLHVNTHRRIARLALAPKSILAVITVMGLLAAPLRGADDGSKDDAPQDAAKIEFFQREVWPILASHCFKCHGGGDKMRGGLSLASRDAVLKGGDIGPAVSLDAPAESMLLEAIEYEGLEMPPSGKLPAKEIAVLRKWVEMGIPWTPGAAAPHEAEAEKGGPPQVNEQTRSHWSFRPLVRPEVPPVENGDWVRNPIDTFILARLEEAGLAPAPPADKAGLLRRAYYDLTGLPPTPEEVQRFLADDSPDAFERVVDRLLESPHYGEKWGRHWLDLVRYAETNSFERDGAKPFVWKYRDYVVESLNADKPYDVFLREQLAGDEMQPASPERIIATGYYRLGQWDDEPADPEQAMYDEFDDIVTITGQVMLGLTINCARCHDHKLDPLPQRDYYRFLAFFRNIRRYGVRSEESVLDASVRSIASEEERRIHAAQTAEHQQKLAAIDRQMEAIESLVRDDFEEVEKEEFKHPRNRVALVEKRVPQFVSADQFDRYKELTQQRQALQRSPPPGLAQALCVKEHGAETPETFVLVRGNPGVPSDEVQPGFPQVLSPPEPDIAPPASDESAGRRLALAEWIASPENPLTARVMANRIWQHHFGRGIVRSTNNFGLQGDAPTHPALLNWLAGEFIASGWRMKEMHKLIMLSSAYQMSAQASGAALEKDPGNDLFSRFNMRRLTAEEVRDSILAVNGSLNLSKVGGPSMYTLIPDEVLAGQSRPGAGWGRSSQEERNRRSVYIHVKRSLIDPVLASFDAADVDASCPVRFATTQPTQALALLNSEFIHREARQFAGYLRREAGDDAAEQVKTALWRVLQRAPTAGEIERGMELMARLQHEHGADEGHALDYFCVVALNLNEFMYLD